MLKRRGNARLHKRKVNPARQQLHLKRQQRHEQTTREHSLGVFPPALGYLSGGDRD